LEGELVKDQYFGDINDFRKYGFLRALLSNGKLKLLIAWMLTDKDKKKDGKFRSYSHLRKFDEVLYDRLAFLLKPPAQPRVKLIEESDLLSRTVFYSRLVEDSKDKRKSWREGLKEKISGKDLVFFDPDNGIEVTSKKPGRKDYSKYVAWDEMKMAWEKGCSILIYQHFPHKTHEVFASEKVFELKKLTGSNFIRAFKASQVLYLLVGQEKHRVIFIEVIDKFLQSWEGEIQIMDPVTSRK
jgi:hypothetical protein